MSSLDSHLDAAVTSGSLMSSTRENLLQAFPTLEPWAQKSVQELLDTKAWTELNDRFYAKLKFGTGGIRGRTIGKTVTASEKGTPNALGCPEHAAVGTNMMNDANIRRAAQGLGEYLLKAFPNQRNKIVIAHDTRHFSRYFSELVAASVQRQGIDAYLFAEERSTPQLSFSVRWLKAQAGIVISASHNPFHDNGFKCYFHDGAQVVEPHASGIIAEVNRLAEGASPTESKTPGSLTILGSEADEAYQKALRELVLEPSEIEKAKNSLKIVYTSLHGTGIKIIPTLLRHFGFQVSLLEAQSGGDGRFPTVKSPNPENAEALELAIQQAKKEGADLIIATDPDCDRMGVAIRNGAGEFEIISGNLIGSIMAYYRTERFFSKGIINDSNKSRAALIKTFVTTDLQKAIAKHYGIKCIDTLTGFKYIGEKLGNYQALTGIADYDSQSFEKRREVQLARGTFFIFGGEESYGYSGGDYVRDKDGNAAALMFAEVAAWAKNRNQTLLQYLDAIYQKFGFYTEKLGQLTFEGAAGAATIQKLLQSYRATPPQKFLGQPVVEVQNFAQETYQDADGKEIPKETMLLFHLQDGSRMAVRGSGTEPKIKFYFFTQASVQKDLEQTKSSCRETLNRWWDEVQQDVKIRTA